MDDIIADVMNGIVKSIGIILMVLFFVQWQINVSKQQQEEEKRKNEPLKESEVNETERSE